MNSENNNNGTVLGSVNPNPMPSPEPQNGIENLSGNVGPMPEMVNNGVVNSEVPVEPVMPDVPVNPPMPEAPVMPDVPVVSVGPEIVAPPVSPIPPESPSEVPVNTEPLINQSLNMESNESAVPSMESAPVPPVEGSIPPVTPTNVENNMAPPIEPMPSFTNPQMVNMNQPTGFENPNTIGSNPPMSFEPEKSPKKKKNKIMFIILILVILAFVGLGTYYVLNYTNLLNNKSSVEITTKNLEVNLGDELSTSIGDYAIVRNTNIQNCSLNTTSVDIEKAGVYEYTITCGVTKKSGKVTVIDNAELITNLKDVYKAKGETLDASEFTDDNDLKLEFVDNNDVDKYLSGNPGIYTIKLNATKNNKTTEVEGKIIVLEYPLKGFYTCTGAEQSVPDSKAKMTIGDMFVIVNGENVVNGYGKVAYEVHIFNFKDALDEYNELVNKYNKEGTLTINNITGKVTIDEENKTITIQNKELTNEEVIAKYGEDNLKDYASIRDYFNKLNSSQSDETYTCKYVKSN